LPFFSFCRRAMVAKSKKQRQPRPPKKKQQAAATKSTATTSKSKTTPNAQARLPMLPATSQRRLLL
jgi:hypothetical protein